MARQQVHTTRQTDERFSVSMWQQAWENGLLAVVLAIAALRATFTETPHIEAMGQTGFLSNEAISLLLSTGLLAALALWVLVGALTGRLSWRKTFFTLAVTVFAIIGSVGVWFASDKRAAVTDLVVMLSGPAAGLLAVQLFNRKEKVRLFLWLLLAIAAAATYACYDKLTASNDQLIAEYEKDPNAFLAVFGIEPGSLEHWQYEHRLYSRDVSGFLTTSNSAGSFFLLAVFAGIGLCLEAWGARRGSEETLAALLCTLLATVLVLAGLTMTQSKGAIGAFLLFGGVLFVCVVFGKALWRYRRPVSVVLIIGVLAAVTALIAYGVQHGRLPGGNSMLVRWQYWTASAEMAADRPLLGTGGGNYATYYLKYKNPAAPETIKDSHNWFLSLLCRFGVAGLAAMGLAMLRPAGRLLTSGLRNQDLGDQAKKDSYRERYLWLVLLAGTMVALILIRPAVMQLNGRGQSPQEQAAALFLLIVIPAGIIAVVFGLLRFAGAGDTSFCGSHTRLQLALACGLAAVLVHNLIDFALFEPGVWTLFWLTAAAGIALVQGQRDDHGWRIITFSTFPQRTGVALLPVVVMGAVVAVAVIPPVQRGKLTYQAIQAATTTDAKQLLERAVTADRLSPEAAMTGARLLMQRFRDRVVVKDKQLLDQAQTFADTAIARSPADPRPRRLLADILLAVADMTENKAERQNLQEAAYTALQEAVHRYPGADMIHYRLGVLAEELGNDTAAVQHLLTALDIEMAYQAQFRVMYPQQEKVVSRLGPSVYADLRERLTRIKQRLNSKDTE